MNARSAAGNGSHEQRNYPIGVHVISVEQLTGKMVNPPKIVDKFGIEQVPFEMPLVKFVDHIIDERIALGRPDEITSEKAWNLVEFIVRGWKAIYPEYADAFFKNMANIRAHAPRNGIVKEGEARLQHQLEIPQSLWALLSKAFPNQKWDRKFIISFAKRFKGFTGAETI